VQLNQHRGGSGEPLVLVHGIGSRWQIWSPVLERLEAERDVLAFDLPGFGDSPMPPPGTPPGIASLTTLVSEYLDEVGLERPHVAGNSLGGWIALELAKRGAVRSATALSPGGFATGTDNTYARVSLAIAVSGARRMAPRADRLMRRPRMRQFAFNQMVVHPKRLTPGEAADNIRALANAPWFDESLKAVRAEQFSGGERIDVPVTVAWGEKDRLLLPRQAKRAARLIPQGRHVTLTGCGHVPMSDDPEQVKAVILEGSSPV
jgi:pimeloyl-ACP methyl ester carboxylesterase